ncbi:hypothetical protein [Falsibacillus pallidus]|uniref:Uncharacterized protein n=1 Tax=Falsibacillus pallidus TaxID=493781 RepID=A0A370G8B9_9BACI|nr:hypothetical protein [Falsibacillus pallidus]RDI40038.1 hypothetical protein DFR59_11362 [Falsibacillus pallidus]
METNQVLQAVKELGTQMNDRFDRLESRVEKVESRLDLVETRLDRLEEGQQVIKDQLELLVKEHWENKTDIHKLKKIIRIAQS